MGRRRTCTDTAPARRVRCITDGARAMTHTCRYFPGHDARHRCACGHAWPNTAAEPAAPAAPNQPPPTHRRGARRRIPKEPS